MPTVKWMNWFRNNQTDETKSDFDIIKARSLEFKNVVDAFKVKRPDVSWYPYNSILNVENFAQFAGEGREALVDIAGRSVADIGVGDGDMAFFMESLGAEVTIIDYPQTNYNNCRGLLELRSALGSKSSVHFMDLEWATWISGNFDFILFLGTLYHLRNPGLVLNTLAHCSERMLISTMVFVRSEKGENVSDQSLAYFLECRERNNDPTNYWMFTPKALRLLLRRSGWIVVDEVLVGDTEIATPYHGDARVFAYCKRVANWNDLRRHHDF